MAYVPVEKLINEKNPSIYKIVLTAAARANELTQGAQPLVPAKAQSDKVSGVALAEIAAGKVRYEEIKTKGKKS